MHSRNKQTNMPDIAVLINALTWLSTEIVNFKQLKDVTSMAGYVELAG